MQAIAPDEVETVVWIHWLDKEIGHYGTPHGFSAYQYFVTVTLFDRTIPAKTFVTQFEDTSVPTQIPSMQAGDPRQDKLRKQVADYVLGLRDTKPLNLKTASNASN
jgi:hypothetical protein